jgi:predicted GIY-YIG superfamily endonuclease
MELIAFREFSDQTEARRIEAKLKRWKNPTKARAFLELR